MAKTTKTADPQVALKQLLGAWRKACVQVTFSFMASSARERKHVADRFRQLARRQRLKRVGDAELCVNGHPVVALMTYQCDGSPKGFGRAVMDDAAKIVQKHPGVEFHFQFLTKV